MTVLSLSTPEVIDNNPQYDADNQPLELRNALRSPHLSQNRILIQMFNAGLIVHPDKVLLNQYPVDIYVNPTQEILRSKPRELYRNTTPDISEARVGASETTLRDTTHKQFFVVKNSTSGLDLSITYAYHRVYRLSDTNGVVVEAPEATYLIIPSQSCSCSATLKSIAMWSSSGISAMERKTLDAITQRTSSDEGSSAVSEGVTSPVESDAELNPVQEQSSGI